MLSWENWRLFAPWIKRGIKFEHDRLNLTPIQKKVIMKFFRRLRNVFEVITPREEHVSKKR